MSNIKLTYEKLFYLLSSKNIACIPCLQAYYIVQALLTQLQYSGDIDQYRFRFDKAWLRIHIQHASIFGSTIYEYDISELTLENFIIYEIHTS